MTDAITPLDTPTTGHAVYDTTLLRFVGGVHKDETAAKDAMAEYRKGAGKGHKLEVRAV